MGIQACNSYNKIELEEFLRKTVGNQTKVEQNCYWHDPGS